MPKQLLSRPNIASIKRGSHLLHLPTSTPLETEPSVCQRLPCEFPSELGSVPSFNFSKPFQTGLQPLACLLLLMRWCALVLYHQSCFSKVWSNGQSTQPRVTPVFSLMRSYCKHLLFAQYANCKGSREGGRLALIRSMTSRMNLFTLVVYKLSTCRFSSLV